MGRVLKVVLYTSLTRRDVRIWRLDFLDERMVVSILANHVASCDAKFDAIIEFVMHYLHY